jgi:type I restriction enzyme, R subunit
LVDEAVMSVLQIDETKFNTRMKIKYIHTFNRNVAWQDLGDKDLRELRENIAPLIPANEDDELAKRFDYLMYTIEFTSLRGISALKPKKKVVRTAEGLSNKLNIPMVKREEELIKTVLTEEFWEKAELFEYEAVRKALRYLIKFLERESQQLYYTNFADEVLDVNESEQGIMPTDLKSYRKKVNSYLKEHQNDIVVYKLRHNEKLTTHDIKHLEKLLWQDLGTKEDYVGEFGDEPLLSLVSKLVGLDAKAAHDAFSEFLSDETLNTDQQEFVKLIVNYISANGLMDKRILNEQPFTKFGNVAQLFDAKIETARSIIRRIDDLNGRLVVG